ncbi:AAA family ATPase [Neokomagataea thailandica]|uniref:Chromosome partition protein Smc n=1 Tax=Neokomagataea tanensis NBRC 106556 TaxID=1223519 RepID=A0ABQ0QLE2_9PROT|nr:MULTISPECIES: AAA family ATPase [Neokomagataea]GBR49234.1 chromosome partition protein Smc [Neokomagataea tanensis NBRC 106556]
MASSDTTISRLTISGFKSFADEVRVDILPGLTGIVGPNGCGKSNVVEALRWAMGEASARALRGGELDDLIFAGTNARAARNLAQVTLHIANARGLAPAPFHEADELEVTRKAERGSGSEYRINGRVTRARDVQTLFADLASGARSSAIVSQNRVGLLIAAKPEERRLLLEEAAGITGLHARRHDAELKLRQTEANLARAEDLRLQLEERLEQLSEQSGQAKIYRELSEQIRTLEDQLHCLLHARANRAVQRSRDDLARAKETLKQAEQELEKAQIAEFQTRAALPAARKACEDARSTVENLRLEAETARHDLNRARETAASATERLQTTEADLTALTTRLQDSQNTEHETREALAAYENERQKAPTEHAALSADVTRLMAEENAQQRAYDTAQRHYDLESVQQDAARTALSALTTQLEQERHTLNNAEQERAELQKQCENGPPLETLQHRVNEAVAAAETARHAEHTTRQAAQDARLTREQASRAVQDARQQESTFQKTLHDLQQRHVTTQQRLTQDQAAHHDAVSAQLTPEQKAQLATTLEQAKAALSTHQAAENSANMALDTLNARWVQACAASEAGSQRYTALRRALDDAQTHYEHSQKRHAEAEQHVAHCRTEQPDPTLLEQATHAVHTYEQTLTSLEERLSHAETALTTAHKTTEDAQTTERMAEASLLKKRSQAEGLAQSLKDTAQEPHPLIDALSVPSHLTHAVAAALADGIDASLAPDDIPATRRWRCLPQASFDTPDTTPLHTALASLTPLSALLTCPDATRRCFDHILLLPNDADGPSLQTHLHPGHSLVTTKGALWRWDGYHRAASTQDQSAVLLERRRNLTALKKEITAEEACLPALQAQTHTAQTELKTASDTLTALRGQRSIEEHALSQARTTVAQHTQLSTRAADRLEAAVQKAEDTARTLQEAHSRLNAAQTAYQNQKPPEHLKAAADALAQDVQTAQATLNTCRQNRQNAQTALEHAQHTHDQAFLRHRAAEDHMQRLTDSITRTQNDLTALTKALDLHQATPRPDITALEHAAIHAEAHQKNAQKTAQNAALHASSSHTIAQTIRAEFSKREHIITTASARLAVLTPHAMQLRSTYTRLRSEHAAQSTALTQRPDLAALANAQDTALVALTAAKDAHHQAREALTAHTHDAVRRESAITALQTRLNDITHQIQTTAEQHTTLTERVTALRAEHTSAREEPNIIAHSLKKREEALHHAETLLEAARLHETAAEEKARTSQDRLRLLEHTLSEGRATLARLSERAEQAAAAHAKLHAESEAPDPRTPYPQDLSENAETTTRRRLTRLTREREALGPVNLRADLEYEEARTTAETIAREHAELTHAIARLRGAIGSINKEGRERLTAVFAMVDQHFQSLFARMFGGGRAHLGLVGSDDPLEAGLEIFAQPPGKKLSTLSLLSGGEQALTALSLIFATFRCNPAPICVLDEVDAPLDDANVERFCTLLTDMTKEAGTRFLVVTHHQLTMAYMDRLYGVTMQERGVSRVLSVDLKRASAMIDGA